MDFDPQMLDQLDQWIRNKGGRVQVKLINEFYQKDAPFHKNQLHNRLHLLADCNASKVHLVGNAYNSAEYLELKNRGSRPFRLEDVAEKPTAAAAAAAAAAVPPPAPITLAPVGPFPNFIKQNDYHYAVVKSPGAVRAVLEKWQNEYDALAIDLKGDIRSDGKIALLQIATIHRHVLMVDMADNPRVMTDSGLKTYFEDEDRVKVFLDSARSLEAVRTVCNVRIVNVLDLSRSFIITQLGQVPNRQDYQQHGASLVDMMREYGIPFPRANKPGDSLTWFKRPLSASQLEYAARGVMYLCDLYANIMHQAKLLGLEQACFEESAAYSISLFNKPFKSNNLGPSSAQHVSLVHKPLPPPPATTAPTPGSYAPVGNKIDWACVNCKAPNLAKHTTCLMCRTPKPKAKFLVPVVGAGSSNNNNSRDTMRDRQIDRLERAGLTADHCYFFHVENRCLNDKPGKTCGYIHDHEFKALQARELANKKPAPAPMPAPAPASREQMDARRLQELEDEALERALQESLRFEEERVERQRREQEEQIARYQAEAAQRAALEQAQLAAQQRAAQEQAKLAAQQRAAFEQAQALQRQAILRGQEQDHMQYLFQQQKQQFAQQQQQNYAFNFPQPMSSRSQEPPAFPILPPTSTNNNSSLMLTMEIAQIGEQVGIIEQYIPLLISCAQAAGAVSDLKGMNLVKFTTALKDSFMPLSEQKKFVAEVYARKLANKQ